MNSIPQENQQSLRIRFPSEDLNPKLWANGIEVLNYCDNCNVLHGVLFELLKII